MVGGAIVLMGLLLLGAAPGRVRAYHVTHVATLLDESNFLPHIKRAVDSQNHRTVFVRFFLAGQGDRTHRAWEHIANQKHKIHGASFADVVRITSFVSDLDAERQAGYLEGYKKAQQPFEEPAEDGGNDAYGAQRAFVQVAECKAASRAVDRRVRSARR